MISLEMRNCITCGKSFAPAMHRQKYCTIQCRNRLRMQKKRLKRKEEGLCPQCGGLMDHPVRIGSGAKKGGFKISYCNRCRERWKRRYYENKKDLKEV